MDHCCAHLVVLGDDDLARLVNTLVQVSVAVTGDDPMWARAVLRDVGCVIRPAAIALSRD